jgi:hypothetical protein
MKQSALGARFLRDWETIVAKRKRRPRIAENPASWLAGYDDGIVARLQDPARPLRGSDVEGHSLSYLLGYGEGSAQRTDEMVLWEAGKQKPMLRIHVTLRSRAMKGIERRKRLKESVLRELRKLQGRGAARLSSPSAVGA